VRLCARLTSRVKVPTRLCSKPVTEGYCVVETRGGELLEVNNQSVGNKDDSVKYEDEPASDERNLESSSPRSRWMHREMRRKDRSSELKENRENDKPGTHMGWLIMEWLEG